MRECLSTDKICSNFNKKCKDCILDISAHLALEEEEMWFYKTKEEIFKENIKEEYPECADCQYLEIKDMFKGKVKCFYRLNGKCVLKK